MNERAKFIAAYLEHDESFFGTCERFGIISRASFSLDMAQKRPSVRKVNDMYKTRSNRDLNDSTSRELMGLLVLADAIDRAKSTEPDKIQAALKATDLKPDQLIMGYKGVKFDDKGQNILAAGLVIQLQDGENYVAVWPKNQAKTAPVLPYRGW